MDLIHETNRIYLPGTDGGILAEITFPPVEEGVVDLNHTFVDGSLRGQGVAGALVQAAADSLRATARRARVSCSYAQKWFERHPTYQDVLA